MPRNSRHKQLADSRKCGLRRILFAQQYSNFGPRIKVIMLLLKQFLNVSRQKMGCGLAPRRVNSMKDLRGHAEYVLENIWGTCPQNHKDFHFFTQTKEKKIRKGPIAGKKWAGSSKTGIGSESYNYRSYRSRILESQKGFESGIIDEDP